MAKRRWEGGRVVWRGCEAGLSVLRVSGAHSFLPLGHAWFDYCVLRTFVYTSTFISPEVSRASRGTSSPCHLAQHLCSYILRADPLPASGSGQNQRSSFLASSRVGTLLGNPTWVACIAIFNVGPPSHQHLCTWKHTGH